MYGINVLLEILVSAHQLRIRTITIHYKLVSAKEERFHSDDRMCSQDTRLRDGGYEKIMML